MVWMTFFHAAFDFNHFGWIEQNFYADPFWVWQRTAIVSLFLLTAGMGQSIAYQELQPWMRFWRRWFQIALGALVVTAGSWLMYPQSFIYFGVLHGVALMLVVVRLSVTWGRWLWLAGAVALGLSWAAPAFHTRWPELAWLNQPGFNILGLISQKPRTEDFVPLLPWLGVMWWGSALAQTPRVRQALAAKIPGAQALTLLGRRSLVYYLLHQPVLIGTMMLVSFILGRPT